MSSLPSSSKHFENGFPLLPPSLSPYYSSSSSSFFFFFHFLHLLSLPPIASPLPLSSLGGGVASSSFALGWPWVPAKWVAASFFYSSGVDIGRYTWAQIQRSSFKNTDVATSICTLFKTSQKHEFSKFWIYFCHRPLAQGPFCLLEEETVILNCT